MNLKKINYIQIIFHFIATWFFIFSFQSFSYLHNIKLIESTVLNGAKNVAINPEKYGQTLTDIAYFSVWVKLGGFIGLIVAMIISIIISKNKKWFFLNNFVLIIITFILYRQEFLGWNYLKTILSPGQFIADFQLKFIVTGLFLITIGCIIFFSKNINQIIQNLHQKQIEKIK